MLDILSKELESESDRIREALEKLTKCTSAERAEIIGSENAGKIETLFASHDGDQLGDPLDGINKKIERKTFKQDERNINQKYLRLLEGLKKFTTAKS